MRIIDWSSDLCSSDLGSNFLLFRLGFGAALGLLAFALGLGFGQFDLAASLLDRFDRALRRAGYGEIQLCRQFALGEEADAVLAAAGNTSSLERGVIDGRLRVELLRVDQLLDHAPIAEHAEIGRAPGRAKGWTEITN